MLENIIVWRTVYLFNVLQRRIFRRFLQSVAWVGNLQTIKKKNRKADYNQRRPREIYLEEMRSIEKLLQCGLDETDNDLLLKMRYNVGSWGCFINDIAKLHDTMKSFFISETRCQVFDLPKKKRFSDNTLRKILSWVQKKTKCLLSKSPSEVH